MYKVWVIFKKEMKGFLFNPGFYIVCFLCAAVFSWVFPISLRIFDETLKSSMFAQGAPGQQFNIHYGLFLRHLSHYNLLMIFLVPALTMRLFSEEKKLRTFDLLLTSPITSLQIVVGKYMATLGAILVLGLVALLYPFSTAAFASIEWVPLFISFIGIFLVGSVYAAMNLFCSSLTSSAIVAYVMAVVLNISIWFVGIGVEVVDSATARAIFEHISINQHLVNMVEGTVRTSGLIYFSSLIFFFCFLAERVVEASRWR